MKAPRLYNTLTRQKDALATRDPGRVAMYVCGPTVYDYSHLGHARAYVFFDVLCRFLRRRGYAVTYARNVTDLDDKIIRRGAETGEGFEEVARRFTAAFHEDMRDLGCLPPDVEPRATEHIPQMHDLIGRLVDRGVAYVVGGDVYYSVDAFARYGRLSRRTADATMAGARVGVDGRLRSPADFALWKSAKPGEPSWPSPWGPGRPGWHIECSAMSLQYLGADFDIHGGGMDLVFPHHENEIAQAEGALDKPFCRVFVHNGFVNVNKEKMSKSLGNFFLIRQVFSHADPEALRLFLLGTHYRGPIDLAVELDAAGAVRSFPQVADAQKRIVYFYEARRRVEELLAAAPGGAAADGAPAASGEIGERLAGFEEKIMEAMLDDVNTALALGHVSDAFRFINDTLDGLGKADSPARRSAAARMASFIEGVSLTTGLLGRPAAAFLDAWTDRRLARTGLTREFIEGQIEERRAARAREEWKRADEIRATLAARGVELKDGGGATKWGIKD